MKFLLCDYWRSCACMHISMYAYVNLCASSSHRWYIGQHLAILAAPRWKHTAQFKNARLIPREQCRK